MHALSLKTLSRMHLSTRCHLEHAMPATFHATAQYMRCMVHEAMQSIKRMSLMFAPCSDRPYLKFCGLKACATPFLTARHFGVIVSVRRLACPLTSNSCSKITLSHSHSCTSLLCCGNIVVPCKTLREQLESTCLDNCCCLQHRLCVDCKSAKYLACRKGLRLQNTVQRLSSLRPTLNKLFYSCPMSCHAAAQ